MSYLHGSNSHDSENITVTWSFKASEQISYLLYSYVKFILEGDNPWKTESETIVSLFKVHVLTIFMPALMFEDKCFSKFLSWEFRYFQMNFGNPNSQPQMFKLMQKHLTLQCKRLWYILGGSWLRIPFCQCRGRVWSLIWKLDSCWYQLRVHVGSWSWGPEGGKEKAELTYNLWKKETHLALSQVSLDHKNSELGIETPAAKLPPQTDKNT